MRSAMAPQKASNSCEATVTSELASETRGRRLVPDLCQRLSTTLVSIAGKSDGQRRDTSNQNESSLNLHRPCDRCLPPNAN